MGSGRSLHAQQQRANAVNDQAVEFQVLQQEAVSNQMLYENLYTKLQEANVSAGVRASNITVVDPARTAALPVSPKPPLFLAVGLGTGLLLGLSGAFLLENLDRTVVATEQVEAITHGSVLGVIPDFTTPASHRYGHLYGYGRKKIERGNARFQKWFVADFRSGIECCGGLSCGAHRDPVLAGRKGAQDNFGYQRDAGRRQNHRRG